MTRKSGRTVQDRVRLVIMDEIHLLHDTRGAVLEGIVARLKREAKEGVCLMFVKICSSFQMGRRSVWSV